MRSLYSARTPVMPAQYAGGHVSPLMDKLNNIDVDIDSGLDIIDNLPIFPDEEPAYTDENCPTGVYLTWQQMGYGDVGISVLSFEESGVLRAYKRGIKYENSTWECKANGEVVLSIDECHEETLQRSFDGNFLINLSSRNYDIGTYVGTDFDVEIVRASAYGMWSWEGSGPTDLSAGFRLSHDGSVQLMDSTESHGAVGAGFEWRVNPDTTLVEILHSGANEPSIYMKYSNHNNREGNLVVIEPFQG